MTRGLKRYQLSGDLHFVTFSCFQTGSTSVPRRSAHVLKRLWNEQYRFCVIGYVVMPEHVHLLLSEPTEAPLSAAFNSLKLSVSKLSSVLFPLEALWRKTVQQVNRHFRRKRDS